MVKKSKLCKRKGQKLYSVKFKKIKGFPSVGPYYNTCAKSKDTAKRKFKRSIFGRQKVINVVEIK